MGILILLYWMELGESARKTGCGGQVEREVKGLRDIRGDVVASEPQTSTLSRH